MFVSRIINMKIYSLKTKKCLKDVLMFLEKTKIVEFLHCLVQNAFLGKTDCRSIINRLKESYVHFHINK